MFAKGTKGVTVQQYGIWIHAVKQSGARSTVVFSRGMVIPIRGNRAAYSPIALCHVAAFFHDLLSRCAPPVLEGTGESILYTG